MAALGVAQRVVQLHVTRRCNLRCLHCYSTSGPRATDELPAALLEPVIATAAAEGYAIAGFSGGEPTLHPELTRLVSAAKAAGLYTTVTTNGMLLRPDLLAGLADVVDLVAVSVDGGRASHDRLRASPRAYDRMLAGLERLRESGIPFGVIFTLTQYNLDELEGVAELAVGAGARLVSVHPLELVGRAEDELPGGRPDGLELGAAVLEVRRLAEQLGDRALVRLDVFDRALLARRPELVLADVEMLVPDAPLADLVAPLVIEPDGWVVPVEYGFPRRFSLGSLHDAPLDHLAASWRDEVYRDFRQHCRAVHAAATAAGTTGEGRLFNWYEAVLEHPAVLPATQAV